MKLIDPHSADYRIVEEELRLLGRVTTALADFSTQTTGAPDYESAMITLRDQIAEAKPEDIAALVEQMTRIAAIAQRYGKGKDLPIDPESPYFAHLRLNDDDRLRDVLIGKRGYIDRAKNIQIVDWRNAPISRIYYRYEEGDDYDEEFGDHVLEGQILARRNVTIADGQLRRIGCPQGTFVVDTSGAWHHDARSTTVGLKGGQGKAARPPAPMRRGTGESRLGSSSTLAHRADKHLPEIAALIDPAQFNLITQPDSGLVVLQGGAGTGKTTVALHRIAYLNFAAPSRFRPDRILVIVPNRALSRYVEGVLPSLGVNGVRIFVAADWFARVRSKLVPRAPKHYNDETPSAVLRFKKHPLLLSIMSSYVAEQSAHATQTLKQGLQGTPHESVVLAVWEKWSTEPLARRLGGLRQWVSDQSNLPAAAKQPLDTLLKNLRRRARSIVTDWSELLTDKTRLTAAVAAHPHYADQFSQHDIDQVVAWCAKQTEEPPRYDLSDEDKIDATGQALQPDVEGLLDPPDDALLLFLHWLKHGHLRPADGAPFHYEHVVVDEAQDLSAAELKLLVGAAGTRQTVTLAGDTAQRLVFDNAFTDWDALLKQLNTAATTSATLELGYRSTGEVMALARGILGDLARSDAPAMTRSGAPVELHCFNEQGEAVAMLADALRSLMLREPMASVVLITRYLAQAIAYHSALENAEVPSLRLVRAQEFSFKAGIEVTDVTQVKGLEFDYVILLDVNTRNYPDTTESRHLLHIAATRAAHQLWLISVGTPSSILPPEYGTF